MEYFETILENQNILKDSESWKKMLNIIPDETMRKEIEQQWEREGNSTSSQHKWKFVQDTIGKFHKKNPRKHVHLMKEIIFQFIYPRLDSNVSIGVNHLLKSPFCIHPKTGRVCVPINPDECEDFNPLETPTLSQIVTELSQTKSSVSDIKNEGKLI